MVRPERPHGEKASPKWLAGSPDGMDPTRDQTPVGPGGSTVWQPLVARRRRSRPVPHRIRRRSAPLTIVRSQAAVSSGAAEHSRYRMLSCHPSENDETSRSEPEIDGGSAEGACVDHIGAPLLITVEEASELLRLGRTRAYEFIRCGSIQSVKVGRRRLVVRSSLDSFVQSLIADQGELPA